MSAATVPQRPLTAGPGHHWFGYYDKLQFDPSGRYVLGMKVGFEGRFRLTKDLTVTLQGALPRFQDAPEFPATINGQLKYQICSDVVCYPPATQALQWAVRVRKWVR